MTSLGITTLRFTNDQVMNNIEGVHQHLTQYLNTAFEKLTPSHPTSL
jgi:very-short-patch-repair endonuclease